MRTGRTPQTNPPRSTRNAASPHARARSANRPSNAKPPRTNAAKTHWNNQRGATDARTNARKRARAR
eukprot:11198097-Lingulodinium_polyedra.AAC.1